MILDLKTYAAALPSLDKDERRIRLFVVAIQNKALALASDLATLHTASKEAKALAFASESAALLGRWAVKGKKLSFADIFRDPFKDLRQETREFAAKWDLDPVFRQEMG